MPAGLDKSLQLHESQRDCRRYQRPQSLTKMIVEGSPMAAEGLPSPEDLRKVLAYDPETGALTWKSRPVEMFDEGLRGADVSCTAWNGRHNGKPALTAVDGDNYLRGKIFGRRYFAHRVAWAIFHGEWPSGQIDHINGIRDDNRIANLRVVTQAENLRNQRQRRDNTSGRVGVVWRRDAGKWQAAINHNGRRLHLGLFTDFSAASAARDEAERAHGYHQNHGRQA